jgi:hypothetical protein
VAHPASYSMDSGGSFLGWGWGGGGVCKVARVGGCLLTSLHPLPRSRMSGAISTLPLYAFMVCIGTTLPICVIIANTVEWGILHSYAINIFVSRILLDCICMMALYLVQALKL